MPNPTHLLFTDLETTGLDPNQDRIVEAGFILTDTDLTVLAEVHHLVRPTVEAMNRMFADETLLRTHSANGLLTALVTGARPPDRYPDHVLPVAAAEQRVLDLLDRHGVQPSLVHIAGSGVAAFDMPFLAQHMPRLYHYLHYAPIDVGVSRRTWHMWTGGYLVTANQDKTHRALDGARCHLAEAAAFRDVFAVAVTAATAVAS